MQLHIYNGNGHIRSSASDSPVAIFTKFDLLVQDQLQDLMELSVMSIL